MNQQRKDLFEVLVVAVIPFIVAIVLPLFAMYGLGGAENEKNLVKFFLYGVLLYGSIIAIVVVKQLDSQGWFESRPELKPFARLTVHSPRNTLIVQKLQKLGTAGRVMERQISSVA